MIRFEATRDSRHTRHTQPRHDLDTAYVHTWKVHAIHCDAHAPDSVGAQLLHGHLLVPASRPPLSLTAAAAFAVLGLADDDAGAVRDCRLGGAATAARLGVVAFALRLTIMLWLH